MRWFQEERASHGWGSLAVGIALLLGLPALAHQVSRYAPWWVWPGLVVGAALVVLGAAILLAPTLIATRARIPYEFRSPIVLKRAMPAVLPPAVLTPRERAHLRSRTQQFAADLWQYARDHPSPSRTPFGAMTEEWLNEERAARDAERLGLESRFRGELTYLVGEWQRFGLVPTSGPDVHFDWYLGFIGGAGELATRAEVIAKKLDAG